MMFQPGTVGIAQAIRAWRVRQYDETRPELVYRTVCERSWIPNH